MADPVTPNLQLILPVYDEPDWNAPLNANFTLLDTFAGTVALLSPTASQTITQPAGSNLSISGLQVFSTTGGTPSIQLGATPGTSSAQISVPAAGIITLDHAAAGDAGAITQSAVFSAGTGFQIAGAAPNNHFLVGNGTSYVDSATLPGGLVNYQTVEIAGTPVVQQPSLNFLAPLTATNNSGGASTDVSLQASGVTAGSYTAANLTISAAGIITAAASGIGNRIATSTGFYILHADGTIEQWGVSAACATGSYNPTVPVVFPVPFTTLSSVSINCNPTSLPGTSTNVINTIPTSASTAGFTVQLNTSFTDQLVTTGVKTYWRAVGY